MMWDEEKLQILKSEKLEPSNVLAFLFDEVLQKDESIIKAAEYFSASVYL